MVEVGITLRGDIPESTVDYARTKVQHAVSYAHEPVLSAHVVLTESKDPAVERRYRAEASLDVNGTPVRAHATASDMKGAVDRVEGRMQRALVQNADRVRTRHRWIGEAAEHEWRHGDLPTHRENHFPRPLEQREVLRRKTFALEPMTPDEAAFEMDLLGHDFYLFTDRRSGEDAVIYHKGGGQYGLAGASVPNGTPPALFGLAEAAPKLTEEEARTRLDLGGEPFLFFVDPESGRGRLLYLRYDGHYGLITPADE